MKAELLHKLQVSGLLTTFKNHPVWVEAFEAYRNETGDSTANIRCGSCYRKVLRWLKQ